MILISFQEAEEKGFRDMRCPVCGFKVTEVPLTQRRRRTASAHGGQPYPRRREAVLREN